MEPLSNNKPSTGLFLLMTLVFFGAYFGIKYGLVGAGMPWYLQAALIIACLLLVFFIYQKATAKQKADWPD